MKSAPYSHNLSSSSTHPLEYRTLSNNCASPAYVPSGWTPAGSQAIWAPNFLHRLGAPASDGTRPYV